MDGTALHNTSEDCSRGEPCLKPDYFVAAVQRCKLSHHAVGCTNDFSVINWRNYREGLRYCDLWRPCGGSTQSPPVIAPSRPSAAAALCPAEFAHCGQVTLRFILAGEPVAAFRPRRMAMAVAHDELSTALRYAALLGAPGRLAPMGGLPQRDVPEAYAPAVDPTESSVDAKRPASGGSADAETHDARRSGTGGAVGAQNARQKQEAAQILSSVTSMFALPDSSDEDSDDGGLGAGPYARERAAAQEAAARGDARGALEGLAEGHLQFNEAAMLSYWRDRAGEFGLHVCAGDETRAGSEAAYVEGDATDSIGHLAEHGYFVKRPASTPTVAALSQVAAFVRAIKADGWPPVFAFLCDEIWAVIDALWPAMAQVLGDDCVLEPSVFLWALDRHMRRGKAPGLREARAGSAAFSLPHRDYPFDESVDSEGRPCLLNVWIPLVDVDTDNGCMYVLPREFDDLFEAPEDDGHMKAALPGVGGAGDSSGLRLRFDIGAARPLAPHPAGTLMTWNGCTVHWGSRCSSSAETPRSSFACAFRRADAEQTHLQSSSSLGCMTRAEAWRLDLSARGRLCARGLILFGWWFPLGGDALPAEFWSHVKTEATD